MSDKEKPEYDYVATLFVDGKPEEVHFFNMPNYGEKGYNQSHTSCNCFRLREMKYFSNSDCYNPSIPPPRFRTRVELIVNYHSLADSLIRHLAKLSPPKEFHHQSLWDMYLAIGYDYKKKRYIRDGKNKRTLPNLQESNSVSDNSDDGRIPEAGAS